MRKTKLFILLALTACVTLLAACGSRENPPSAHYEAVLDTLVSAVKVHDTSSYLKCFTPEAREDYAASETYDPDLTEKLALSGEGKEYKLIYSTLEHSELDSSGIAKLKKDYAERYRKRIEIMKAYELKVEFSSGDKSTQKMLTVFYNGISWQIMGDVIESYF